jgi:CrcB protein
MSAAQWVMVSLLGGVGALARTVLDGAVARAHRGSYPLGILVVNLAGTLALGLATGLGVGHDHMLLIGTGLLGGFTTFSTWIVDSRRLRDAQLRRESVLNIALSLVLGLLAAGLGWWLGSLLTG